jgi:malate dehydrogenase (oxaloacetate-decarboxylating)(NADP+)
VNNVLGFPYIFRGALDVVAREINDEMKVAAAWAIAALAREPIPEAVSRVYAGEHLSFGPEYLIPKPLDPRLITTIAPAVAKAAIETGVARKTITDWPTYEAQLLERVGMGQKLITGIISQARRDPKTVVFPEALDYEVLKAAEMAVAQGVAHPILLGPVMEIRGLINRHSLNELQEAVIMDPSGEHERIERFAARLFAKRQRRGMTMHEARRLLREYDYFAAALVDAGEADATVSGRTRPYPQIIRPALQVIGTAGAAGAGF